jgi:hypothetical protein
MSPGALRAVPGGVWVVDSELPVVAFVDGLDLSVKVVGDCFAESAAEHGDWHEDAYTAVTAIAGECWVALAEEARRVVRFSAAGKSVFEVSAPVIGLACVRGVCWALLNPAWRGRQQECRPLCRLGQGERPGQVRSFGMETDLWDLTAAGDELFALGHPADEREDRDGSTLVIRVDDDGRLEVVTEIEGPWSRDVRLHSGRRGPWLEFGCRGNDHWIEPLGRSPGGWRRGAPVLVPPGTRICLDDEDAVWAWARAAGDVADFDHSRAVVRLPPGGVAGRPVLLPGEIAAEAASGGRGWCVSVPARPRPLRAPARALLRTAPGPDGDLQVTDVGEWPDIAALIPAPRPPGGADPAAWPEKRRARLESELAGVWVSEETGEESPFIDGTVIESVSLAGAFPATACVIRFRLTDRPGIPFGHRFRLFDDVGGSRWGNSIGMNLKADIEAGGIPPRGGELPGADGVVRI